ncbi:MAG: hypothetical protein O3A53_10870 [Acidobacteria bacterium]|nr:hypothetical protein [Acidobacteriota bacterium]MDA1235293.1 hypothetical protein [Acidobacteriota bacterium]
MMTRRAIIRLLAFSTSTNAVSSPLRAGVPARKATYRGGTITQLEISQRGELSLASADHLVFDAGSADLEVAYTSIRGIEYGQKAGRRLGLAVVVSPVFLLSKKRKHFLTVHFVDTHGDSQAAVFELGKKIVRTTLAALEARTGLRIEYEDEEARKAGGL